MGKRLSLIIIITISIVALSYLYYSKVETPQYEKGYAEQEGYVPVPDNQAEEIAEIRAQIAAESIIGYDTFVIGSHWEEVKDSIKNQCTEFSRNQISGYITVGYRCGNMHVTVQNGAIVSKFGS
jgi:capsular polysaccharide biosynthesis protein